MVFALSWPVVSLLFVANCASSALEQPSEERQHGKVTRFGPKRCVSTWRNKLSRCMIKTDCEEKGVETFDFYVICVDKAGLKVKHSFGQNSFDTNETFDTLIVCQECAALEKSDTTANATLAEVVRELVDDVHGLRKDMLSTADRVRELKQAVFPNSTDTGHQSPASRSTSTKVPQQALLDVRRTDSSIEDVMDADSSNNEPGPKQAAQRGLRGSSDAALEPGLVQPRVAQVQAPFDVFQKVIMKNGGDRDWHTGYVTTVHPLKVSFSQGDEGFSWDNVRHIEVVDSEDEADDED